MYVDPTTLSDLEVFGDREGGGGLLALIDETETASGHAALRRRISHPESAPADIRRVQEAVRFFAGDPSPFPLRRPTEEAVVRYLDSNIETSDAVGPGRQSLEGLWLSVRYKELYRELKEGVATTLQLGSEIERARRRIESGDPPPLLVELLGELHDLLATAIPPWVGARSHRDVVAADRHFRTAGREALRRTMEVFGEVEALRAMAAATVRLGWRMPEPVESERFLLEGEGLRHPFLPEGVGNPVELTGGEPLVFLTGPNMAGKTTWLRCVALSVLLAQAGMGIPALRLRFTPVEVLLTSLNPSDNLRGGLSFFLAEVLRVRTAAEFLVEGRRAFVLFDEVFKGTNVQDALEASAAVILGFARAEGSGFMFSSHLVELADTLAAEPRIRFRRFEGRIDDRTARYSYRILEGVSRQRFGLQLLEEERIPDLLRRIGP